MRADQSIVALRNQVVTEVAKLAFNDKLEQEHDFVPEKIIPGTLPQYRCCVYKEREIVRRGRNAHARHPVPKNQNPDAYAMSTGFEALWGFLYLTGQNERIHMLINHINEVKPYV